MKRNIIIAFALILHFPLLFSSCKEDKDEILMLEVNEEDVDLGSSASSKTIKVTTNISDWNFHIPPAEREWCTAVANGNDLQISVTNNPGKDVRRATIDIKAGHLSTSVKVRQLGSDPAILVSPNKFTIKAGGEKISFNVTSNTEYDITAVPAWMKATEVTRSSGMITTPYQYNIEKNENEGPRTATVIIKDKDSDCLAELRISQDGDKYQADGESGIGDDIKLKVIRGEASSYHNGSGNEGGIEKSFDGDMNTWYHSQWSGKNPEGYFPITLDYYLENAEVLDYVVYYPRTSHSNGNFKEVDVLVKYKGKDGFEKVLEKDFGGSSSAARVVFEPALQNVDAIRFSVKSGVGDDGHGFASCAEMEFYKKNPDNFDPLTLFTDFTCTQLKPGVTEKEIEACTYPLFKNIALYMYKGKYPREFRIDEYKAYPHPDDDAKLNKTGQYSLLDNPTGISVKEGEELIVLVGETSGQTISLRIQNLDMPNEDGFNFASTYPLVEGINKIIPRNKGLLYIMYHTPQFRTVAPVKIHIPSGIVNGYFDSTRHTEPGDWDRLIGNATDKNFDVLGKYAHLTFPTQRFRDHTQKRGKELIDAYDRLVYLEMEFMGLEKYDRMFSNRMYFSVIYKSYMYAAGYHTGYNDNTLHELCNVDLLKTTSIWGPAHEVGHINQTRPGLKWVGTTEVTNNIHSMYVQREFGNSTRLQTESMSGEGGFTNRYEKAMNLYFRSGRPHCYMITEAEKDLVDVFCKLVPFWQLQLYVADARGNKDFYKDLYEIIREEEDKRTEAEHQLEFVVRTCKAAKLNLLDFFEKWGFLTEVNVTVEDYSPAKMEITRAMIDQIKNRVEALGYPKPEHRFEYICDNNLDVYKTSSAITKGTATRSGKRITMNGWKNVAAYEVREGDKLVFVSSEPAFTLDNSISSWNNNYRVYAISSTGQKVEVNF